MSEGGVLVKQPACVVEVPTNVGRYGDMAIAESDLVRAGRMEAGVTISTS